MSSALYVKLDRIGRLLRDVSDNEGPLPRDVSQLLDHAYDDVQEARGKDRSYFPEILGQFDVGDRVVVIVVSYTGKDSSPAGLTVPETRSGKILAPPKNRSVADYENMGDKIWYFTSDLPATSAKEVDATMNVELQSDIREIFHLRNEHWSTWHEKNHAIWSVLTVFGEKRS